MEARGPLAGLKVVELAGLGPAPFAGMLLADMGADVIRVDRPAEGAGVLPAQFDALRRGRRSVILDLRSPGGVRAALDLAERADVLIEGYRPGVAERLGLGPQACWERNPRLVYGRMTGWGQDGPLAHAAGHDIAYVAITGALGAMGRRGGPPAVPLNLLGDFGGGSLYLVTGVLAALFEAGRSGRGQVVDAAIVDGAASLTTLMHAMMAAGLWRDERGVNLLDTGVPWYDVYQTSDGHWMAAGPLEDKFYAEFMSLLGLRADEAERADPRAWPALRQRIAAAFAARTRAEWTKVFDGTDACVAPVLSLTEAADHPHLAARGTFTEVDGVPQPGPAPRFSRTPSAVAGPPARPGAHTREALTDWGVPGVDALIESGAAIQRLRAADAAGSLPSEAEHAVKSPVDVIHQRGWQVADRCLQVGLVQGHQGGDVDHGVFGQPRGCGGQEHVAWHHGQGSVRADDGGDGGIQPARVERIGLDDQDRAPFGRFAAARLAEICPVDAAAAAHQSSWSAR